MIADADAGEMPFSAAELQGELIYCFLSAGLRDSTCFAEDIALAVEYSLHEKYEFNGKISAGELTSMVVETLENAGFFTVADWFKRRNGRQAEEMHPVTPENLRKIAARQGMLFSAGTEDNVLRRAAHTFELMNAVECPMGLITEMLRFYYEQEKDAAKTAGKPAKKVFECDYLVEIKDVTDMFPEFLQVLTETGILRINNITVYHPSIRMFLDCNKYAEYFKLSGVFTEMMWSPHASKIAQSMDSAIETMQEVFNRKCAGRKLPVYLTVNNLERFMEKYFGVCGGKSKKLAKTLVDGFGTEMFYDLYKVRF